MKKCSYCNHEADGEAVHCGGCGTEFPVREEPVSASLPAEVPTESGNAEIDGINLDFQVVEGFSRPNWKLISQTIQETIPSPDRNAAWDSVVSRWLRELASDLGGCSRVCRTDHFFCLSDLDAETTDGLIRHAEVALNTIRDCLKDAAWTGLAGKHVLLLFADAEDYFAYVSSLIPDGAHPQSLGVFLRDGYAHVAVNCGNLPFAGQAIAHELVHNLLCHLPIPSWLNEGLAVTIEKQLSNQKFLLDQESAEDQYANWNERNLQEFWAGKTFQVPGPGFTASYGLAEVLARLLLEKGPAFKDFVLRADWRDAGQDAALKCLDTDLGELAAGFLGPGNWRPQRKAIADCWKKEEPAANGAPNTDE